MHLDEEGIRLDQVQDQITRLRAEGREPKLIYTIPTYHNPTGMTMSLQRRIDLVDLAAREGVYILEDTRLRRTLLQRRASAIDLRRRQRARAS